MNQITAESKEFYEILKDFENMKITRGRYDKEPKEIWSKGFYFQDGNVNELFKVFLSGCNYGIMLSNLEYK